MSAPITFMATEATMAALSNGTTLAGRRRTQPKGMRALLAAWIKRSWHHTFTDPRFTRTVHR